MANHVRELFNSTEVRSLCFAVNHSEEEGIPFADDKSIHYYTDSFLMESVVKILKREGLRKESVEILNSVLERLKWVVEGTTVGFSLRGKE